MASDASLQAGGQESRGPTWFYPEPTPDFKTVRGYFAFCPSRFDACNVAEHRVETRPGDFYGGWITPEIVGPFKGGAGTMGW